MGELKMVSTNLTMSMSHCHAMLHFTTHY